MDIQIEKVLRPLDLGDYLGEGENAYRGKTLSVWVNPDGKTRMERQSLLLEYARALSQPAKKWTRFFPRAEKKLDTGKLNDLQERNYAWLATVLNQDADSPCPVGDLKKLHAADSVLYQWILTRVVDMIAAYQEEKKSASKPPSKN